MNKTILIAVVVAVVFGGAGYWYGSSQAQNAATAATAARTAGFGGGAGGSGTRGGASLRGGNGAFGTIIAKDATSITVQLGGANATSTNGTATGSKIVLYDASTQIGKMVTGSASDLSIGQSVTASGTTNSDGSITATSIQIRPASAQRAAGQ